MDGIIGFIGFGLIGGSIAKRIKKIYPHYTIMAYSNSVNELIDASNDGIVNVILDSIDKRFSTCDMIFLCAPVTYNIAYLPLLKSLIKPSCIITDVGSTKTGIHQSVSFLLLEHSFIGGHPMAGSEKSGYKHSSTHLIENVYYIITPTKQTPTSNLEFFTHFIASLGAIPLVLDYETHDFIVATISHLPHIVAAQLVQLVMEHDTQNETMKQIAAGGFKDITRIASCSPILWEQICMDNRHHLIPILETYIHGLKDTLSVLKKGESEKIYNLFHTSGTYRNSMTHSVSGPIPPKYSIYCNLIDKTGAIATVATILSNSNISIKNIGIVHNREQFEGALNIQFYDNTSYEQAKKTLQEHGYSIFF